MKENILKKTRTAGALLVLLLAIAAMSAAAMAASAKLAYSLSQAGAGTLRAYVYSRGNKAYLQDQGGYFNIYIPDAAKKESVYLEASANNGFSFKSYQSNDIKIFKDQSGTVYCTFTLSSDANQTRHVQLNFSSTHVHTMKLIPRVEPTCTKPGNKQYYQCTTCGKYFEDQNGNRQTTVKKMTLKALGHKWNKGVVTKRATTSSTGTILYTCQRCGTTKTSTIPKLKTDPFYNGAITPDDPASFSTVEKNILKLKYNGIPKNSTFGILCLKGTAKKSTKLKLTWKKVPTAKKYVVYGREKGKKFKKLTTTSSRSYKPKKVSSQKYYKYVVVAVNGNKAVAVSRSIFISPYGGGYENIVRTVADPDAISVKVGHTHQLNVTETLDEVQDGKYKNLRPLRYESSDDYIASVSKEGIVTGLSAGVCTVRAYSQDGVYDEISVSVHK